MCEHLGTEQVRHFHAFVAEKAHVMEPPAMARHIHEHVASANGGDPVPSEEEIAAHIQRHMLHPSVRVALTLRSLLELAEVLRGMAVARDDDGQPLVDVRTVGVYLKVVAEIMQVYRTADTSRMLFAGMDEG
jgi:hypothetical protein